MTSDAGMTDHMFETDAGDDGFDIVALNIQRGRDHGLPPYNDWRQYCGQTRLQSFDDMGDDGTVYNRVYEYECMNGGVGGWRMGGWMGRWVAGVGGLGG